MKPKISIITLGVADLEKATHFYENGLNLPRYQWDGDITFFMLDGTWLSLFPKDKLEKDIGIHINKPEYASFTLAHNVANKAAVDTVLATAQNAGATILKAAEEKAWGGYSGYFSDLDNYIWEVAWNPHQDLT